MHFPHIIDQLRENNTLTLSCIAICITIIICLFSYYYIYIFNRKYITKESDTELKQTTVKDLSNIILLYNPTSGGFSEYHIESWYSYEKQGLRLINITESNVITTISNITPSQDTRLIVCGGDISFNYGTVGWTFDILRKANWSFIPPVCIVPLGTGNDLAKSFNCSIISVFYSFKTDVLLDWVYRADSYTLDRWLFHTNSSNTTQYFTNYIGFGVDAAVALLFHKMRHNYPFLFHYQPINVIWYAWNILLELIKPTISKLTNLELMVDGEKVDVSKYQSIVILNIPYFCGGGLPLGSSFGYSQCSDQEIEIVAFNSIPHILAAKFGFTKGYLLAKGKVIQWKLTSSCPVQTDGEPWMQEASEGSISYSYSVPILVDSKKQIKAMFYSGKSICSNAN